MDDARKAVLMFVENDYNKALNMQKCCTAIILTVKMQTALSLKKHYAMIDGDEILINRKSTVVFKSHWHKGVVGIVASRLIEKYYRPTVVLTQSGEVVAGSARSVSGFNLYEAIHACREHLLGYGGHFAAAGLTMLPENVDAFSDIFEEIVEATIEPHLLIPEIIIDTELF